jgi:mono/diheme cytochrome c family protein
MKEGPERIDYEETPDVTEVHAAVKREHAEPIAESTPMPLWLTAVCGVAVLWAGAYFGIFHGGLSGSIFNEYWSDPSKIWPTEKGPVGPEGDNLPLIVQGKSVFGNCVGCHGPGGAGVPGQFPPLAGSHFVQGGEKRLVAILLKGISGPITVEGKPFNGQMPTWESLSDKKIAAVATYIRGSFGNTAGEISIAKVAAARKMFADRKTPWNEADLLQISETENLPDEGGAAPAAPAGDAKPAAGAPAPAAGAAPAPAGAAPAPAPAAASPAGAAPAPAAAAAGSFDIKASAERGKTVYMQTCFACHQITGMGLPGAFPPLVGSEYTTGDARRMVAMVLLGVNPPLKVKDMVYVAPMPAPGLAFPILKDDKNLADVVNYVRNSWGNKDDKGVTPEFVAAVRQEFSARTNPWTEAELLNFPPPTK